jgi:hypothetical protein
MDEEPATCLKLGRRTSLQLANSFIYRAGFFGFSRHSRDLVHELPPRWHTYDETRRIMHPQLVQMHHAPQINRPWFWCAVWSRHGHVAYTN